MDEQSRIRELENALRDLIEEAVGMDFQIDQEFGVGKYVEHESITRARAILTKSPAVTG